MVAVTCNVGEAVWILAELLLFASGKRLAGLQAATCWPSSSTPRLGAGRWVADARGEWAASDTAARWTR